jgi:hypothetical protein
MDIADSALMATEPYDFDNKSDLEIATSFMGDADCLPPHIVTKFPHLPELVNLINKPPFMVRNIKIHGRSVITWMKLLFENAVEFTHQNPPTTLPDTLRLPPVRIPPFPKMAHASVSDSCMQYPQYLHTNQVMFAFLHRPTSRLVHLTIESTRTLNNWSFVALEAYGQSFFRTKEPGMIEVFHQLERSFLSTCCQMVHTAAGPLHLIRIRPSNKPAYLQLLIAFD